MAELQLAKDCEQEILKRLKKLAQQKQERAERVRWLAETVEEFITQPKGF